MPWVDSRIRLAEQTIEDILRRLRADEDAIKAVRQSVQRLGQALPQQGQTGGGGGVMVCWCSESVQGNWNGQVPASPGSFTADIYQVQGGSAALVGAGQMVTNWMPAATVIDRACIVLPDGGGGYVVVAQSCT